MKTETLSLRLSKKAKTLLKLIATKEDLAMTVILENLIRKEAKEQDIILNDTTSSIKS